VVTRSAETTRLSCDNTACEQVPRVSTCAEGPTERLPWSGPVRRTIDKRSDPDKGLTRRLPAGRLSCSETVASRLVKAVDGQEQPHTVLDRLADDHRRESRVPTFRAQPDRRRRLTWILSTIGRFVCPSTAELGRRSRPRGGRKRRVTAGTARGVGAGCHPPTRASAKRSRWSAWRRPASIRSSPTTCSPPSMTAAVWEPLCASIPMTNTMPSSWLSAVVVPRRADLMRVSLLSPLSSHAAARSPAGGRFVRKPTKPVAGHS
jgi:hypothetical protein